MKRFFYSYLYEQETLDLEWQTGILASGPVVQWLERTAHNGVVVGSNPTGPTVASS
jgi:hypothetical protein